MSNISQQIVDNLSSNNPVATNQINFQNLLPAEFIETIKFYALMAIGIIVLSIIISVISKAMTHRAIMSIKKDVREINRKLDKLS